MRGIGQMSRLSFAVAGAAAMGVAGGGVALAATSGGAKTINVCVKHEGGTLYQAAKCAPRDKHLSWNARGPAGPAGAAGATGPAGVAGAQGVPGTPGVAGPKGNNGTNGTNGSDGTDGTDGAVAALSTGEVATGAGVDLTNGQTKTVASLSLPAGTWVLHAKTQIGGSATAAGFTNITCTLADGSTADTSQWTGPFQSELFAYVAETAVPLQIAVTNSTASTVTLACHQVAGSGTNLSSGASDAEIDAVQSSTLD